MGEREDDKLGCKREFKREKKEWLAKARMEEKERRRKRMLKW